MSGRAGQGRVDPEQGVGRATSRRRSARSDCPRRDDRYLPPMAEGTPARSDPPRESETDLSVYYDGGCPLCRAEIGHYRRCAGSERVRFVDVGRGAPAAALGEGLDREAALRRFHVRDAQGRLVSGAAAFARLWQTLPGWRWLGRLVALKVLGVRPLLPVAEAAYRLFLPLRPTLARVVTRLRG